MIKIFLFRVLFITLVLFSQQALCQTVDTTSVKINTRLSFYSFEKNGEFLLNLPPGLLQKNLSVTISNGAESISIWNGNATRSILRIPFQIIKEPKEYKITAIIKVTPNAAVIYKAATKLIVLSYKQNEVKTDKLTGGLIVNRRQLFPFGFYCYSPVDPTLPEEEVVRGFNMISPYQKILPETLNNRKSYMDRCAELGMKVHYNLLSVSGGGGVGSKIDGLSDEEKSARLIAEIKTFRDHPALLCWYIADEPNGYHIPPEQLEKIYRTVKEYDPWHPVSIVFMAPFLSSKLYANSFDVVMADPYPVPDVPVSLTGDVAGMLRSEFAGKRPVWMAIQTFGGGEIWEREPTLQEMRSMTWQSIIKGATGIQYFVRQGFNYFPKSTATWSECGRIAMEVAELTPWLLSDEETPEIISNSQNVIASSKMHEGLLIVMAVNKVNKPVSTVLNIRGFNSGTARVLFENRSVPITGGSINDQLSPFGSQVYLINVKKQNQSSDASKTNLLIDPGFEDLSSPGIPSACYARPGGDKGATFFIDTRDHYEGNHSLRLITPEENKSMVIRFFPVQVKAGSSYVISLWAKSDPEMRFSMLPKKETDRLNSKKLMPQYVEILLGEFAHARFVPDSEWRQFVTFVTIPADTLAKFKTNLILKMPGQGVAWFDQLRVFEEKR